MRLLKSLSLSAVSTAARLFAALAAFSVVARVLGPSQFGVLMLCMSIATLLMLLSNFGLVTYLLREIGRQPEAGAELFGQALGAKLLVSVPVLVLGMVPLVLLPQDAATPYVLLLGAMWLESLTELSNAGLRARQRFAVEARLALTGALINASCVALVAWRSAALVPIAIAYLVSRGLVAALAWRAVVAALGSFSLGSLASAGRQLRQSISYAVDSALTSAFGQIDSVVLNHFLGPAAVGLHQAGMRLFLAGQQGATVLANVFLPRASAAQATGTSAAATEFTRLQWAFLAVGASFGLTLACAADWYVVRIFGAQYQPLAQIMPWFGLLFAVKFAAAAWGVVLTAQGRQTFRAAAAAGHWVVVAAIAAWSVPRNGNVGWLFALLVGNGLLGLVYAGRAASWSANDKKVLAATIALLLVFIPLVQFS